MRSKIKRLLSLVLILITVFSLFFMTSCNRRYDEAEVISATEALLRRAEMLNEVYYGDGIQYLDIGHTEGYYHEADPIHLATLGFTTIEQLKSLTLETFTVGYSNQIFGTKLSMIEDEEGIQEMTRYYQKYDTSDILTPVCIMVYKNAKKTLRSDIEYDYSTIRVTGVKRQTVFVTVTAEVTNDEGKSQLVDIELDLIEEDDGWRIDNPCYANYNDSLDRLNELENKK